MGKSDRWALSPKWDTTPARFEDHHHGRGKRWMENQEAGEECCETPSSGHDMVTAPLTSQRLGWPARDQANMISQHASGKHSLESMDYKRRRAQRWEGPCWGAGSRYFMCMYKLVKNKGRYSQNIMELSENGNLVFQLFNDLKIAWILW